MCGLLSSLLFQLSTESDLCYQVLSHLYSNHSRGTQEPVKDALLQCLVDMLSAPGQPARYIIIDALNKCPNNPGMLTTCEEVLSFLEDLVKLKLPNIHICVSSCTEINIQQVLAPLSPIHIPLHDEGGQKDDISSYIKGGGASDCKVRRWREEDKQLVIDTLSDKVDRM